ncbi:hypothetical protein PAXRUDRAFT_165762 [Paxillus rubicundulus Ve08.2h10]|uniref:Uncharacterized protein n=1 Tax=Paxillus rubicundulus Ve08.2h10 TaxID=930991 RepID=A0A0D0DB11_9AGAM|nr:hypothetical protein PAXRUDRAFT_165762 [Paxillus rubicundulus Ve08.2h10]
MSSPLLNCHSTQELSVATVTELLLHRNVSQLLIIQPYAGPEEDEAGHVLESHPILEGAWLDHPTHPQNIEETLVGPVGEVSIFCEESLVSILEGINLPIVTKTYDDDELSLCLTHHQGYKKSSIGSKYDIHQFLRTNSIKCSDIHPFHYTIKTLDPNDLDENNLSPVWDIPTIQKWNKVMDDIARRRYWADHSRSRALHRSLARRLEMLAASLRENALLPWIKKRSYDQIQEDIKFASEKELGYKRIRGEHHMILELIPDLIKMPVHPLTGLSHWLRYPYTVGDSLNPEAIYQEITGHEILTWGYLNSLDTSKIVFSYVNRQNLLNKAQLLHTKDVSVKNPHFFLILNFHILEANNGHTWTNTYISLSFFDEFGFNFFDSDLSVPTENALNAYETPIVSRTESQEALTFYQEISSVQTPPKTNIPLPPVALPNFPIKEDMNQTFQQITEFISLGIF